MREAEEMVTEDILHIYNLASVPTIHPIKVRQKVEWVTKLVKQRRKEWSFDERFEGKMFWESTDRKQVTAK